MGFARLAEGLYIYIPRVTCARSLRALTAADPGFRVGWGAQVGVVRSRPGERAGGGHPSCPASGYGGRL